jgi:hypothetical protein
MNEDPSEPRDGNATKQAPSDIPFQHEQTPLLDAFFKLFPLKSSLKIANYGFHVSY